jgi:hypothetical protein
MGIINAECYPDFKSVEIIEKGYSIQIIRQKNLCQKVIEMVELYIRVVNTFLVSNCFAFFSLDINLKIF